VHLPFLDECASLLWSVRDCTALRLRLSGRSYHQRQPLAFTTGDIAMPQNPQSHFANQPRSNDEPGMSHEEDVSSDRKE